MPPSSKPNATAPSHPSRASEPAKSPELQQLERDLRGKLLELRETPPKQVHSLTVEIQRLRVTVMCLRELETGVADQNAYREMNLLNRLLGDQTFGEGRGEEEEREQQIEAAKKVLEKRGIRAEAAPGLLRALKALTDLPTPAVEDDGEPEPIAPIDVVEPTQPTH